MVVLNGTAIAVPLKDLGSATSCFGGATLVAQMGFDVFDGTTEVVLPKNTHGSATSVAHIYFISQTV